MRRLLLLIALVACVTTPASASPTPTTIVCEAGPDRVVYDFRSARYFASGAYVGSSECAATHMAIFSGACQKSAAFRFLFAGIPGPPILGGKSARLEVGGRTRLLACAPR